VFPSAKLSQLEEGGWVFVGDAEMMSVLGFEKLRESLPWRGQQPLPSPD